MKKLISISIIFTLLIGVCLGQEQEESSSSEVINEITGGGEDQQSKLLQVISSVEPAKKQYEACLEAKVELEKLDECLWEGNQSQGGEILALDPEAKKEIEKALYANGLASKIDLEIATTKLDDKNPAIRNLKKYFEEKLQKHIYGEQPKMKAVDHKIFSDLFRAQLGKNLISGITSYCIEADPEKGFLMSKKIKERDEIRKKNVEELSTSFQSTADKWKTCVSLIQHICYKRDEDFTIEVGSLKETINYAKTKKCENPDDDKCDLDYSQQRACTLTSYLKKVRSNLMAMESLDKQWGEMRQSSRARIEMGRSDRNSGFQAVNIQEYSGRGEGEKTVDQLVSISSNEAVNASGYADGLEERKAEFEKCRSEDGTQFDEEACKKFLETDHEKAKRVVAEFSVRSRAIEKRLEGENGANSTPEENEELVRNVMKEEGFSDTQIDEEIEKNLTADQLKKKIQERYQAEREALVKEFASQIKDKQSAQEGTIDAVADKAALDKISEELEGDVRRYKELVHFNNIVSGFLEVDSDDADKKNGKVKRNVASMKLELEDSAYEQDERNDGRIPSNVGSGSTNTANEANVNIENIRTAVEAAGVDLNEEVEEGDATNIGKDTINRSILNYSKDDDNNGSQ